MNLYLAIILIVIAFALGFLVRGFKSVGKLLIDKTNPLCLIYQIELNEDYDFDKKRRVILVIDPTAKLESRKQQGL